MTNGLVILDVNQKFSKDGSVDFDSLWERLLKASTDMSVGG